MPDDEKAAVVTEGREDWPLGAVPVATEYRVKHVEWPRSAAGIAAQDADDATQILAFVRAEIDEPDEWQIETRFVSTWRVTRETGPA